MCASAQMNGPIRSLGFNVLLENITQPLCMKHTLAESSFAMCDSLVLTSPGGLGFDLGSKVKVKTDPDSVKVLTATLFHDTSQGS